MEQSVQLAALLRQVAPPAFTDYWVPMIGLVGELAARQPQAALRWRLPMDWAYGRGRVVWVSWGTAWNS